MNINICSLLDLESDISIKVEEPWPLRPTSILLWSSEALKIWARPLWPVENYEETMVEWKSWNILNECSLDCVEVEVYAAYWRYWRLRIGDCWRLLSFTLETAAWRPAWSCDLLYQRGAATCVEKAVRNSLNIADVWVFNQFEENAWSLMKIQNRIGKAKMKWNSNIAWFRARCYLLSVTTTNDHVRAKANKICGVSIELWMWRAIEWGWSLRNVGLRHA